MLTHDKAYKLSKILNADKERAKRLLSLSPRDATAEINALGHNFSVAEIKEYGDALRANIRGHLTNRALGGATGGVSCDGESLVDQLGIPISAWRIDHIKW